MEACKPMQEQGKGTRVRKRQIEKDLRDFYIVLYLLLIVLVITSHK